MKKILVICVAFVMSSTAAHSQILISLLLGDKLNSDKLEFGLDGGFTYSTIQGLDGADFKGGFNLGFYFDIKIKDTPWKFNTGVMVKSPSGAKNIPVYSLNDPLLDSAFAGGTYDRKLTYFNVPLMLKYSSKKHFYAKAGIMLSLRSKCSDVFNNTYAGEDIQVSRDIKKLYTLIDAGATAGIGYRLLGGNGMNIGVQYYQGLVNVNTNKSISDQKNSAFYFNVGIPIGKGKAKEKSSGDSKQEL